DLEGAFGDVLFPGEERTRIRELWRAALSDVERATRARAPVSLRARDGTLVPLEARLTQLPAAQGGTFELVTFSLRQTLSPAGSGLAELLVEISAQLLSERSEEGVKDAVVKIFGRARGYAAFCAAPREGVREPLPKPPFDFLPGYAQEALAEGRPVFAGPG